MKSTENFEIGDVIKMSRDGGNNTSAPEHQIYMAGPNAKSLRKGDGPFIITDIRKDGRYGGHESNEYYYSLILDSGQVAWANHCELVSKSENYEIY